MKSTLTRLGVVALLIAVGMALPACSQQEPPAPAPEPAPEQPAPEPEPEPEPAEPEPAGDWQEAPAQQRVLTPEELNQQGVLKTIYFDYDKAEIRPDQRDTMQANAAWLRQNPSARVIIEGHADERGTREYNLALGDRRAAAARDYLVSLGIDANRLETVSYGEERPAATGSNEAAWSQNRRAEFVIVAIEG